MLQKSQTNYECYADVPCTEYILISQYLLVYFKQFWEFFNIYWASLNGAGYMPYRAYTRQWQTGLCLCLACHILRRASPRVPTTTFTLELREQLEKHNMTFHSICCKGIHVSFQDLEARLIVLFDSKRGRNNTVTEGEKNLASSKVTTFLAINMTKYQQGRLRVMLDADDCSHIYIHNCIIFNFIPNKLCRLVTKCRTATVV
jgi:hypothetical protein